MSTYDYTILVCFFPDFFILILADSVCWLETVGGTGTLRIWHVESSIQTGVQAGR